MSASLGTLLIVDDEEMNRDMLGRRLELEGFTVATAAGGPEALRLVSERTFDAVLLDVMMPGQNGYEVLAVLRQSYSSIELPVLMVTAKSQSEDMIHAFEAGANDYITKPINFPVALARINCHLGSKRLSTQLRESETRYALSAQGTNDGLWDWDFVTDQVHFSPRWKAMLGYAETEITSAPDEWFQRVHPADLPHVQHAMELHRSGRSDRFEVEHRMRNKVGTYAWMLTRGIAIRDFRGQAIRMAGSQSDITRGKAADPLTGLANRALFTDHLEATVLEAQQQPESQFAVLFLDLDRFKTINDSLGHHAGDELLRTVAERLESCTRATDIISRTSETCTLARFGGDEFVILLKRLTLPSHATQVADRILQTISEPMLLNGHPVSVSASIGIAIGSSGNGNAEELLRDADTAMYHAKVSGKSRWSLFEQSMRLQAVERLALETEMRQAIQRKEFLIYYQPIVSLTSSRIEGFEALLRWQHVTRGLVSPADFIPIAEETGLIVELGAWVLEQACRQIRAWQNQYVTESPLFMSVNVSCRQFSDPGLIDKVTSCLQRHGLDPKCLRLEITESSIMSNPELAAQTLQRLRTTGVHISLDDFGTGHSSLSYLQQFPIDTLKIDRSFIKRLGGSREAQEIVRTIISLAHSLGMEVTAEGIEEHSQHLQLCADMCEKGQGYLYSRPVPGVNIEALMNAREFSALPAAPATPDRQLCQV